MAADRSRRRGRGPVAPAGLGAGAHRVMLDPVARETRVWRMGGARRRAGPDSLSLPRGYDELAPWPVVSGSGSESGRGQTTWGCWMGVRAVTTTWCARPADGASPTPPWRSAACRRTAPTRKHQTRTFGDEQVPGELRRETCSSVRPSSRHGRVRRPRHPARHRDASPGGARSAFLRRGGGAFDSGACEGDDAVDQVE